MIVKKGGEMKVFVYSKKDNQTLAKIKNVSFVQEPETEALINIIDYEGNKYTFNTNKVKTRIYQN